LKRKQYFHLNILCLGNEGVGKKIFLMCALFSVRGGDIKDWDEVLYYSKNGSYTGSYITTDFEGKRVSISPTTQIEFVDQKDIGDNYHGFFLFFSFDDRKSFEDIEKYYKCIPENKYAVVLVGTKTDLPKKEVNISEALELASKLGIHYVQISSKTKENVSKAIDIMIVETLKKSVQFSTTKNMIRIKNVACSVI